MVPTPLILFGSSPPCTHAADLADSGTDGRFLLWGSTNHRRGCDLTQSSFRAKITEKEHRRLFWGRAVPASLRRALQVHEKRASTPVSRIGAEYTQNTALLSTFLHPQTPHIVSSK